MANRRELIRRELERLATQPARSGREAMAQVTALRTLERLDQEPKRAAAGSVDLDSRAPAGYWHPGPEEMQALDARDSVRVRERWRARLEAP